MTCGDKFNKNCPTGGSRVDPSEVGGRPVCDHPGCGKPLLGSGECVDGHVQGQVSAAARALPAAIGSEAYPVAHAIHDLMQWANQESAADFPLQVADSGNELALLLRRGTRSLTTRAEELTTALAVAGNQPPEVLAPLQQELALVQAVAAFKQQAGITGTGQAALKQFYRWAREQPPGVACIKCGQPLSPTTGQCPNGHSQYYQEASTQPSLESAYQSAEENFERGRAMGSGETPDLWQACSALYAAVKGYESVLASWPEDPTRRVTPSAVRVHSLDELKQLAAAGPSEFSMQLQGGFASSKTIGYDPATDHFYIWHEIDDTTQNLLARNLQRRAPHIVEAIEKGALWARVSAAESETVERTRLRSALQEWLAQTTDADKAARLRALIASMEATLPPVAPEEVVQAVRSEAFRGSTTAEGSDPAAVPVQRALVEYYASRARELHWRAQGAWECAHPQPAPPPPPPSSRLARTALGAALMWPRDAVAVPQAESGFSVVHGPAHDSLIVEDTGGPVLLTLLPEENTPSAAFRQQAGVELRRLLGYLQNAEDTMPVTIWPEEVLRKALRLRGRWRPLAQEPEWSELWRDRKDRAVAEGAGLLAGRDVDAVVLDVGSGELALVTLLPKVNDTPAHFRQQASRLLEAASSAEFGAAG